MIKVVRAHLEGEEQGEIAAVMDTVTNDVSWGTRATTFVEGKSALREHYSAPFLPPGQFRSQNFYACADEDAQRVMTLFEMVRPGDRSVPHFCRVRLPGRSHFFGDHLPRCVGAELRWLTWLRWLKC